MKGFLDGRKYQKKRNERHSILDMEVIIPRGMFLLDWKTLSQNIKDKTGRLEDTLKIQKIKWVKHKKVMTKLSELKN